MASNASAADPFALNLILTIQVIPRDMSPDAQWPRHIANDVRWICDDVLLSLLNAAVRSTILNRLLVLSDESRRYLNYR